MVKEIVGLRPTERVVMTKKYYKVVTQGLKSYMSSYTDGILTVQYKVGEFVSGKFNSGLYVFNNYQNAKVFQKSIGDQFRLSYIYEVEVRQPDKILLIYLIHFYSEKAASLLQRRKNKKEFMSLMDEWGCESFPEGTKCFKEVKLLRRVS